MKMKMATPRYFMLPVRGMNWGDTALYIRRSKRRKWSFVASRLNCKILLYNNTFLRIHGRTVSRENITEAPKITFRRFIYFLHASIS